MLFLPFHRETDILEGNAFERMFDENKECIMQRKQRYSAGVTDAELLSACEAVRRSYSSSREKQKGPLGWKKGKAGGGCNSGRRQQQHPIGSWPWWQQLAPLYGGEMMSCLWTYLRANSHGKPEAGHPGLRSHTPGD